MRRYTSTAAECVEQGVGEKEGGCKLVPAQVGRTLPPPPHVRMQVCVRSQLSRRPCLLGKQQRLREHECAWTLPNWRGLGRSGRLCEHALGRGVVENAASRAELRGCLHELPRLTDSRAAFASHPLLSVYMCHPVWHWPAWMLG